MNMERKRLYKSTDDCMLFGVCGGVAEYFHVDSTIIRLLVVLFCLILFSTWLQGAITARLSLTALAPLARTIAAMAAGLVQVAVLFPLEKFVLFKAR